MIRIRVGSNSRLRRERDQRGYPIHRSSFVASIGVHAVAILTISFLSVSSRTPERPVFDELIKANESKITYYDFKTKTPEVVAQKKVGASPNPRGAELSKQALIATAPKAASKQQTIWVPTPKIEIHRDFPAPNPVARPNASLPPPPAPPKPHPRTFVPPPPLD